MKHTNTVMQQYCRAVRKKLPLPARQRRQLLAGLQEELAESAPDCTTLDALIAQFGTPDENAQELLDNFVIIACSEELAKLLPVRLAAWDHPAFDYRFDAVVYSVSSALGFAAVENILYVLQSDLRTAVSRAILSVPGHFFFAVSMGLLLSRAKQAECCGQLRRRRVLALLALAVPTLLHGLWDFLLAAGSRWAVIAFYAFVAAFFITADVCLRRASRTDSRL